MLRRLYPAEITPLSIRAPANAISTTANWIFNFMVSSMVPDLLHSRDMGANRYQVVMVTPVAFANIGYKSVSDASS